MKKNNNDQFCRTILNGFWLCNFRFVLTPAAYRNDNAGGTQFIASDDPNPGDYHLNQTDLRLGQ